MYLLGLRLSPQNIVGKARYSTSGSLKILNGISPSPGANVKLTFRSSCSSGCVGISCNNVSRCMILCDSSISSTSILNTDWLLCIWFSFMLCSLTGLSVSLHFSSKFSTDSCGNIFWIDKSFWSLFSSDSTFLSYSLSNQSVFSWIPTSWNKLLFLIK